MFKDLSLRELLLHAVPWRQVVESLSEVEDSRPSAEGIKTGYLNLPNMFRREWEKDCKRLEEVDDFTTSKLLRSSDISG